MRALGYLSAGVAVVGILAFFLLRGSTPSFIIPVIVVSCVLSIPLIVVGNILSNRAENRKMYHWVQCGKKMTGKELRYSSNICPVCGSTVFA